MIGQVRAPAQHVREVCDNLYPTYLNDALTSVLQSGVQTLRQQYPTTPIVVESHGVEPSQMRDEVKIAGRQIMRQAIHNSLAHAYPARIAVTLTYGDDGGIILMIRDDGVGFVPRPLREWRTDSHHGLANMHERAELIGGALQVVSAPGQDTTILVCIPPHTLASEQPPPQLSFPRP